VSEHTHTQERKPRSQYTHNSEMLPNSSLPPEARTAPKGDNNKIISLQEPTPSSEKREPVRVSDPLDRLKKRPEAYERDKIEPWDGSFFSSFKKAKRSNRSETPLRKEQHLQPIFTHRLLVRAVQNTSLSIRHPADH
jgi:hypothetical protein